MASAEDRVCTEPHVRRGGSAGKPSPPQKPADLPLGLIGCATHSEPSRFCCQDTNHRDFPADRSHAPHIWRGGASKPEYELVQIHF